MITLGTEVVMMQDSNLPILKRRQKRLSGFPFQKSAHSFTAWTDGVGHTVGRVDRANQDDYHWIKEREEQGGMGVWIPMSMTMTDRMDQENAGLER